MLQVYPYNKLNPTFRVSTSPPSFLWSAYCKSSSPVSYVTKITHCMELHSSPALQLEGTTTKTAILPDPEAVQHSSHSHKIHFNIIVPFLSVFEAAAF